MSNSRLDYFDSLYFDDDDPLPPMGELLETSNVEASIFRNASELIETLGFRDTFPELMGKTLNQPYHVIESNVGDDSNVTTDLLMYGLLTLCTAVHVSFIKLSMKDIGISKWLANYAEGWMLTPPSAGSSFEAVNRYNKGRGLAFCLDPVKLKLLSAVRKQSSEEMDLESKLSHLAEIAAWTDRSWFTYDFHQMSLLLANCVFDFNDARSFPFLYKTEGGCGGLPPYGNLATAFSALHHYTRGRSKRAILGVMQESVAVSNDRMAPKDTFFLRASHLANAGDKQWAHYESAYRTMVDRGQLSRAEARDILRELTGSELNQDILSLGFEVTPERFTVGSAIGQLRDKGYLMTEIDVKLLEQKLEKERSVFGKKPIGDLLLEQEEAARLFKSQSWKLLTQLYEGSDAVRRSVDGKLGSITDGFESFAVIAEDYYRLRGDHNAQFTSFFYTDTIRVFKTKDVQDYFGVKDPALARDFAKSEVIPAYRPMLEENRLKREARDEVESWLESGDLNEILRGPLPTGIGTDDSRILKEIWEQPVNKNVTGHVTVLLTDDSGLVRTSAAILKQKDWGKRTTAAVCQLRRNDYMAICLQGVREDYDNKLSGLTEAPRLIKVPYYNYILRKMWYLPNEVVGGIRDMVPGNWRKSVETKLYYDVPNLERGLERTTYRSDTNSITVWGGGCLSRLTVDNLPWGRSWAELPFSVITKWDDFSSLKRRTVHARYVKVRPSAFVARPERVIATRAINHWLDASIKASTAAPD
jgi:hypothetical protein